MASQSDETFNAAMRKNFARDWRGLDPPVLRALRRLFDAGLELGLSVPCDKCGENIGEPENEEASEARGK